MRPAAASLANLPSVSEMLRAEGLDARKAFGQHFLFDLNICRKISKIAEIIPGRRVLEIGPGPGGLTRALLEAGADVTVVEKDPRFIPLLRKLAEAADGRLSIHQGDALTFDEAGSLGPEPTIVANLPYNVGSPLLVKWLTASLRPRSLTLMFQAEVARRIVARPGQSDYGRLSVITQAIADARIAMTLPARAFTPPPKVQSAVVRLLPRPDRPSGALISQLQIVTAAAFGQRRKKLRSSLRAMGGAALCETADVDPDARAETISVARFLGLAAAALQS